MMGKKTLLWLVFFLNILHGAEAAEFAARMVVQEKGRLMPGKIYVKDGKMRQEFLDENGHTITIVRRDKRLVWVVMPWERCYIELPLGPRLPGQFLQIPPEAVSRRVLGIEEMGGYQVERVEVTMPGGFRQTFWVAPKLGLPIKGVSPDRHFSVEYQEIREKKLEDRLFEIPPGCQKVSASSSPP